MVVSFFQPLGLPKISNMKIPISTAGAIPGNVPEESREKNLGEEGQPFQEKSLPGIHTGQPDLGSEMWEPCMKNS